MANTQDGIRAEVECELDRVNAGTCIDLNARPITPQDLIEAVAARLKFNPSLFRTKSRHPRLVAARRMVVLICRRATTASYPEIHKAIIADANNNTGHTAAMYQHKRALDHGPKFQAMANQIEAQLRSAHQ